MKQFKKLSGGVLILLILIAGSQNIRAGEPCGWGCLEIPSPQDALFVLGEPLRGELSSESIRVLNWNVYKGDLGSFKDSFYRLAQGRDLFLLQEIVKQSPKVEPVLLSVPGFGWMEAISFVMSSGTPTGVALGASVKPKNVRYLRSQDVEPFALTPKVSLLAEFSILNLKEKLLVATVHALNFTDDASFTRQIQAIGKQLFQHRGPVLVAGDFNTWNEARFQILDQWMSEAGLKRASYDNVGNHPSVGLQLDHAYTRGLVVKKAHFINEVVNVGSDHPALELDLVVPRKKIRQ